MKDAQRDLANELPKLQPRNRKRAIAVGCMATLHQISSLRSCCHKQRHRRFRQMLYVAYVAAEIRFWSGYSADMAAVHGAAVQGELFGGVNVA